MKAFGSLMLAMSTIAIAVGGMATAQAASPSAAQMTTARANGLAWLLKHQQGDGSWKSAPGLDVQTTQAVASAFAYAGVYTGESYSSGMAFLGASQPQSVDGLYSKMLGLYQTGLDVSALDQTLLGFRNTTGSWGTFKGFEFSVLDTAAAVHIHATVNQSASDLVSPLCLLLMTQQSSGGWAYTTPTTNLSSVPAIAPTVAATGGLVAAYLQNAQTGTCTSSGSTTSQTYQVITAILNAVAYLKNNKQNADGGFGDGGVSSVLDTALVGQVLSSVSDPALDGARTYMLTQQGTDGSWGGDAFLTALAVSIFPHDAMTMTVKDGVPDAVKQVLNLNINAPSRGYVPGNGQSVAGTNSAQAIGRATQWMLYSQTLTGAGGTAPYTFALASGELPDGLSLSSSGVVSGNPTTAGTFSFTVALTDSTGKVSYVVDQIQVDESDPGGADSPTLPQWAAILMGALMLAAVATNNRRLHT